MPEHKGFTREEATATEAGRIRGIILDAIANRVGQVPDVHPRLLEGIEVAARLLATPAPDVAFDYGYVDAIPAPEAARCRCGHARLDHIESVATCQERDRNLPCGCTNFVTRPAPDLPTTVQADRDAGQVRLTEKDLKHLRWLVDHDKAPSFGAPVVRSLLDALAARQPDPDATERVEWGVRWDDPKGPDYQYPFDTLAGARRRAGKHPDMPSALVRRTVTTSAWEVAES